MRLLYIVEPFLQYTSIHDLLNKTNSRFYGVFFFLVLDHTVLFCPLEVYATYFSSFFHHTPSEADSRGINDKIN